MAKQTSRAATFVSTLVFYDEPQLILLRQTKILFLAIAVPSEAGMLFLATTVNAGDWEKYKADRVDLRYLFTFPLKRSFYYFDLSEIKDKKVKMKRFDGNVPDSHFPEAGFFASDHTESDYESDLTDEFETLYLDGEWELPELGRFQQKLSDVYTFLYSIDDWRETDDRSSLHSKKIKEAFTKRPFRGGSSYGAYFSDLENRLKISERVRLKSIQKASPGNMKIAGSAEIFDEVQQLVENYLKHRSAVSLAYRDAHKYLQGKKLLSKSVANFEPSAIEAAELTRYSRRLSETLNLGCLKELGEITGGNSLGTLKVILAMFRRIERAAEFFAQGRASFYEPPT
jgi:hypothetical protein